MTFAASLLALCGMLIGQQEPAEAAAPGDVPAPAPARLKAIAEFKADSADYAIRLDSRPNDKLALRKEPLLHWGNPARNGEDGAVFVWMLDGRPQVIGSVFSFPWRDEIRRKHEYQSLASEPLTADFRGDRVWAPRAPGITFQPVPGAPEPAAAARLRLIQMKALAREFSARIIDRKEQRSELRLVSQPLLRYEPTDKRVLEGAVFSFSLGTDPEVLLLLEARSEKDHAVWHYAFARFHFVDLMAYHKDQEVWHVTLIPDIQAVPIGSAEFQDSTYAIYRVK